MIRTPNRLRGENYRRYRRRYIDWKRKGKRRIRVLFYPILAVRFLFEQLSQGYLPKWDRTLFHMDSWLERRLYYAIRKQYKYYVYAQYPLGHYWIDLAIPCIRLALECDGYKYHSTEEAKKSDRRRDAYMRSQGWTVVRFTTKQIKYRLPEVMERIDDCVYRLLEQQANDNL